jgi:hypothetical protein
LFPLAIRIAISAKGIAEVRVGCRQVRLVSGVKRADAHRFYLRKGMIIEAHYFSIDLQTQD